MVEAGVQVDGRRQQKRRNIALGGLLVALVAIIMLVTMVRLSEGTHREAAKRAAEAEAAGIQARDIPGAAPATEPGADETEGNPQ